MSHHATKSLFRLLAVASLSVAGLLPAAAAMAQAGTSLATFDNICLSEARRAEAQHGIPEGLLQSITRVEAGRKTVTGEFMPWAWTLNDRGEGLFFDSREQALEHLQAAVDIGDHSVDVGCMQVNTKWHMEGFLALSDMLDPVQNADYAAGFLLDLHEAHQSWDDAVKHYHSAEPEKNVRYHSRVLAELEIFLAAGRAEASAGKAAPVAPDMEPGIGAGAAGLELASMTSPSDMTAAMPAPVAPPAPPIPFPVPGPAPLPMDQPIATPPAKSDIRPAVGIADGAPATTPPATRAPVAARQPNLAPHWDRVEKFRRLLARGAS